MAIKIYDKFAPRANVGDTNYPNGSIKNESVPGAKDGTPLDAAWGNDYAGFDAALFAEAGVTPSGSPDTALVSQRLDALKKVFTSKSVSKSLYISDYDGLAVLGDYTPALTQAYSDLVDGGKLYINKHIRIDGTWIPKANTTTIMFENTVMLTKSQSVLADTQVLIQNENVRFKGGTLLSPAEYDADNVEWTYAVVLITAEGFRWKRPKLVNLKKVGIGFRGVSTGEVTHPNINGGFPSDGYTGTQTVHFGIAIDPSATPANCEISIDGGKISKCVQGVFAGNYGDAASAYGCKINGITFENCWNHGIYNAGGLDGMLVTHITAIGCQVPIALTGKYHIIDTCVFTTDTTGLYSDVTGISLRDPVGCSINNIIIKGDGLDTSSIIDLRNAITTTISDTSVTNVKMFIESGKSRMVSVGANSLDVNNVTISKISGWAKGRDNDNLIVIQSGGACYDNTVDFCNLKSKGKSGGVAIIGGDNCSIRSNKFTFDYVNSGADPLLVAAAFTLSACTNSSIEGNTAKVPAAKGGNTSFRAFWEVGGSNNKFTNNTPLLTGDGIATLSKWITSSTSGSLINESGSGAPNLNAGPGSMWRRTDGGALTSLYIKESGTGASGWVGK